MARAAALCAARAGAVRDRLEAERHGVPRHRRGLGGVGSLVFDEMGCLEVAHIVGIFN